MNLFWYIFINIIAKSMCVLWLVNQLCFIVPSRNIYYDYSHGYCHSHYYSYYDYFYYYCHCHYCYYHCHYRHVMLLSLCITMTFSLQSVNFQIAPLERSPIAKSTAARVTSAILTTQLSVSLVSHQVLSSFCWLCCWICFQELSTVYTSNVTCFVFFLVQTE